MKMADGGLADPRTNASFATDTASQSSVGLDLTPIGNDQGQLGPMVSPAPETLRPLHPRAWLADAGFLANSEIEEFAEPSCGTEPYTCQSALPRIRAPRPRNLPLPSDSPALASGASG